MTKVHSDTTKKVDEKWTNAVFYTRSPTLFSACEKGRRTAGTGELRRAACTLKTRTFRPVEAEFARRLSSRGSRRFSKRILHCLAAVFQKALFSCLVVLAVKGEKLWPVKTIIPFGEKYIICHFCSLSQWWDTYGFKGHGGQKALPLKTSSYACI